VFTVGIDRDHLAEGNMNAMLAMTIQQVAEQVFTTCKHISPDGTTALWPIGLDGEGYEQCIVCGKVVCTEPLDDEDPPKRYGL